VHFSPVNAVVPGPESRVMRFFSAATGMTAMAVPLFTMSTAMSTWFSSNHFRAVLEAMSGLFWWSAETTSTGLPSTFPPKSATAILTARTEPGPARSE
jgi:hypothetical protein